MLSGSESPASNYSKKDQTSTIPFLSSDSSVTLDGEPLCLNACTDLNLRTRNFTVFTKERKCRPGAGETPSKSVPSNEKRRSNAICQGARPRHFFYFSILTSSNKSIPLYIGEGEIGVEKEGIALLLMIAVVLNIIAMVFMLFTDAVLSAKALIDLILIVSTALMAFLIGATVLHKPST